MRVRQPVLDAILDHAWRDRPRECCGLLIGTETVIVEAVVCANAATEPERRYVIAPDEYFAQIRRCRQLGNGLRVVGAYHSHPLGRPEPSPTDLGEAFTGFLYLIAGRFGPDAEPEVRAYTLTDGNLHPVNLVPDAQEANP
jgi:proteasome lid subunit RPN8/RPN11